ncbi:EVE domain-containing protein [Profundibacter amoris]|uniref:EVE domain-containing protein n=1 Tax=Profundibacter amoris TaxID=2171755 RepID=UPI001E4922C4|nr:EVE domain-containing protein [Profundibacter amoris]
MAVASAEHVRIGRDQGFMQVNHGKLPPLRRVHPGDHVVYYSPSEVLRKPDGLQSFTAIGEVCDKEPYQASMHGGTFHPYRRDVDWYSVQETPIRPLLDHLEFTRGKQNWGSQMRFGLFKISRQDMDLIAETMQAEWP